MASAISTFFDAYSTQTEIHTALTCVIEQLNVHLHIAKLKITREETIILSTTFAKIGQFFQIKFPSLTVSSSLTQTTQTTQSMQITSFAEMFSAIQQMHIHQNVDSDLYEAAYPKIVKSPICQCAYHEEELFDHLHICAIITGIYAIRANFNVFHSCLTGLMHDIGKPACIRIFDGGNIGYPYHGEYGSMILARLYTKDFEQFITLSEYELMLRCISIHMCSYHISDFQSNWSQERVNSTRVESDSVKSLLQLLQYGDVFAAINMMDDKNDFIKSRTLYANMLSEQYQTTKTKFVIVVRGRSGSGKSTFAKYFEDLAKTFGLTSKHVERDVCIANVVRKMQGLDEIDYRPVSSEYNDLYRFYKDNKLGSQVNAYMLQQIQYSIDMFDVTIIDTQMTLFRGVEQIIPANISNCVVIGFDISRNILLSDDAKNGCSLQSQLELFGSSSALYPLDMNRISIFSLSSSYTHNSKPIGFSCDFVFSIGYNDQFNGNNSVGLGYFGDFFQKLIQITRNLLNLPNMSSLNINTDLMNLVQYVNHLYQTNDNSFDVVCQILRTQCYHVGTPSQLKGTEYEKMFMSIKYLDHNNNWNTWGRESRGTTLILIDGVWKWHKYLMQRGAEMLTGMQVKRGIDKTDNIDTKMDFKASHLSQSQQSLIHDLRVGNPVNLAVSFKKDGSLLSCCLYTGDRAKLVRKIILAHCDEFTQTVMTEYDKISETLDVFVFQSNSTLFIADQMYDYTTTAIFPEAEPTLNPIEKIKTYGHSFFSRMSNLFSGINGDVKLVLGETICANRTESYSGKIHTELAMSYPSSSFTILSITSISDDSYTVAPHYLCSDLIFNAGFVEPAFWMVDSVEKMDKLIQDVDGYIFQTKTIEDFYLGHPPSNKYSYELVIDCEGFVVYDIPRGNSYGKIKTDSYYKSHKLRDDNIPFLCELNNVAGHIFPLARIVATTIVHLESKLVLINKELVELISSDAMTQYLNPKAKNGFDKRPKDVQFKIIINIARDKYAELGFNIFQTHFPSLVLSDDMKCFVVNYSMKTELWLDEPKQITEELKSILVTHLVGSSH